MTRDICAHCDALRGEPCRWPMHGPGPCVSMPSFTSEPPMSEANATQHGGAHYRAKPIQLWDYISANGIGYLEGNAIKYLSRWRDKGGIEDLRKAQHYVQKLIEVETARKGAV